MVTHLLDTTLTSHIAKLQMGFRNSLALFFQLFWILFFFSFVVSHNKAIFSTASLP